jgi:hypothetical protein
MGLDEEGIGWHSFKRFRKTWLRGHRCLEDINNFWMGHTPQTMCELYSHLHEELEMRLEEAEQVGLIGERTVQIPLGYAKPKQLTRFTTDDIFDFSWSLDGTRLLLTRGYVISNAVYGSVLVENVLQACPAW